VVAGQARRLEDRFASIGSSLEAAATTRREPIPAVVISDRPIWLTDVLGRASIALPDEDLSSLGRLGRTFDTSWLVVVDERGRYPDALLADGARACLADAPVALRSDGADGGGSPADVPADARDDSSASSWLFIIEPGCGTTAEAGA
jgi:hypothetical protein